jgi:hypothetical protein
VIGLPPGRKWIVLVDWTTLETAKVSLDAWRKLRPQEVDYSARKVQAHMKRMTKYVTPTAAVKEALQHVAAMRGRPR